MKRLVAFLIATPIAWALLVWKLGMPTSTTSASLRETSVSSSRPFEFIRGELFVPFVVREFVFRLLHAPLHHRMVTMSLSLPAPIAP